MPYRPPRWCNARLGDVTCQLRHGHDGAHHAETGPPIPDSEGSLQAQVLSWWTPLGTP